MPNELLHTDDGYTIKKDRVTIHIEDLGAVFAHDFNPKDVIDNCRVFEVAERSKHTDNFGGFYGEDFDTMKEVKEAINSIPAMRVAIIAITAENKGLVSDGARLTYEAVRSLDSVTAKQARAFLVKPVPEGEFLEVIEGELLNFMRDTYEAYWQGEVYAYRITDNVTGRELAVSDLYDGRDGYERAIADAEDEANRVRLGWYFWLSFAIVNPLMRFKFA